MLKFDGYDEALLGQAAVWQRVGTADHRIPTNIYSGPKIVGILMKRDGMTELEAHEFLDYNIEGAYVGPDTPIVVWPARPHEES
jgi:hypothetical protein